MYALDVHSAGGGETLSEHPHPARPYTHCNENPIYEFLSWELRGLSPNFHIHVSVSYSTVFIYSQDQSTYFLQKNRQIDCGNI
jgi:hypothetical protein